MTQSPSNRVLITGHMGFIGTWTSILFNKIGWNVYGVDNRSSDGERLYDVAGISELITDERIMDVTRPADLKLYVGKIKPNIIIHLAGQAIVPRAFKEPFETFQSNALGTLSVLEAALAEPSVGAAVCVTSDKVYENNGSGLPFSESDPLGGSDIYSVSKTAAELICRSFVRVHAQNSLNIQTVRLGNVVGGGDWSHNRLLPDLIRAIRTESPFLARNLNATRPFQHVCDVARGLANISLSSFTRDLETGGTWNLGPRNDTSAYVRDVVSSFKKSFPSLIIGTNENNIKEDLTLSVSVQMYARRFGDPRDDSNAAILRAVNWYYDYYDGANIHELIDRDLLQ